MSLFDADSDTYPQPLPISKLSLHVTQWQEKKNSENQLTHYQLNGWEDAKASDPVYLISLARYLLTREQAGKLLVHCEAGVGRAGTFTQLLLMVRAHDAEELTAGNAIKWFVESMINSREQRGTHAFVLNDSQVHMLLKALAQLTGIAEADIFKGVEQSLAQFRQPQ